jgi:hypothetical protein
LFKTPAGAPPDSAHSGGKDAGAQPFGDDMNQFTPKSVALFTLSSLTMAMLMQACGGSDNAIAQTVAPPDPIQGFWQSSVTLTDCASGTTIGGFRGLTTFHASGTATADNNTPAATKGVAMGAWTRNANGTYVLNMRFWRYAADGTPAGQQRLTRTLTLAADGQTLTSTITTQALDSADNVVQSACGRETGAKLS